jgi:hypothetical protein
MGTVANTEALWDIYQGGTKACSFRVQTPERHYFPLLRGAEVKCNQRIGSARKGHSKWTELTQSLDLMKERVGSE